MSLEGLEVTGTVVRGQQRGRLLGFPTANVDQGDTPLPADGLYAGLACLTSGEQLGDADCRVAAISVGTNPTFAGQLRTVEAYLLDFDGDLYGQELRLHFGPIVREMEKFDSVEALIVQMDADVAAVRAQASPDRHPMLHPELRQAS